MSKSFDDLVEKAIASAGGDPGAALGRLLSSYSHDREVRSVLNRWLSDALEREIAQRSKP